MGAESAIEKSMRQHAKDKRVWTRKFVSPNNTSVPDRIFIAKGAVVFVEIKAPKEEPTEKQFDEMDFIRKAGGVAVWVDRLKDGRALIDLLANDDVGSVSLMTQPNGRFTLDIENDLF